MKKILVGLFGALGVTNAFANPACAFCTLAFGAVLYFTRKLHVCDNAVAVWFGALLVLLGYWAIKWFDKKHWYFPGRDIILMLLSFSMIASVYIYDLKYKPCYWIFDAFLFWAIIGGAVYVFSQKLYEFMKKHNNNHAHFPFEKVVLALVMLGLTSFLVAKYAAGIQMPF